MKKSRNDIEPVIRRIVIAVVVMPPLTTCVVRGFPSFRDGTSIACPYGTDLSFVLPEREEATARPRTGRCGCIAAARRSFCLHATPRP